MRVPLTVLDFIERAELVYGDRIGVVDEPDQPAESLGELTWAEVARLARAQAAGLDALGVGHGERVAIVSHNSARLLTSFFGVSAYGRVLVPINFRLNAEEIAYIVEHSGASVLLVDPELEDALAGVTARHRFVIGKAADDALLRFDTAPEPWIADEDATGDDQLHERHHRASEGRAAHAPHALDQRDDLRLADRRERPRRVSSGRCRCSTATAGACRTRSRAWAARHIVLRKVDGAEILRRVERHGVTLLCGAPAVVAAILDAAQKWEGEIPGRDRVRMVVAGAPPPTKMIEQMETELGWEFIQIYGLTETAPLLTMSRGREEWDDAHPRRARAEARARRRARAGRAPEHQRPGRGARAVERRARGLLGTAGGDGRRARGRLVPHRRRRDDRRRQLPHDQRPQEGRDHLRRRERQLDRGRGLPLPAPGGRGSVRDRRARREVGRDGEGARRAEARRATRPRPT